MAPPSRSADVGHVGEVAVELLLVVVPQRQAPDAVGAGVAGLGCRWLREASASSFEREHRPGRVPAEADDAGAGEVAMSTTTAGSKRSV
jgi:hypothetical protein